MRRSCYMKASAVGRPAVWSTAIWAATIAPRAAPVALAAAAAKEVFDLLRARSHRVTVLSYLRAANAGTYLNIDQCPASPALVLSMASPCSWEPGDEEGADSVLPYSKTPRDGSGADPGDFCIKQRADWLAFAGARARSWQDAEDAVSHAVQKIFEHHAVHGTLCPDTRDPVAWSKTVIRNFLIDRYREGQRRRSGFLLPPASGDVADDVTDRIMAGKAMAFVASLDPQAHMIAMMRWVEGQEPKQIAEQLGMNPRTVRTTLHRTKKKMRAQLGVAEPQRILREETA